MKFIRLFFDDGANANGTGAGGASPNAAASGAENANVDNASTNNSTDAGGNGAAAVTPLFTAEELKDLGVSTPEEAKVLLRDLRNKQLEASKPDADKEKEAELERVNVRKYAVEKGLMKDADFSKLESYTAKQDRELVYDSWRQQWNEENPHLSGDEADRQAQEDFESEYQLNSTNQKTKQRGLSRLSKDASELRGPLQKNYDSVLGQFREEQTISQKLPEFNKWVDGIINSTLKDKITVTTKDGETEIPIEADLTEDQKKEVRKIFKSAKVFAQYNSADKNKIADVEKAIAKKIEGYIRVNNFEAIAQAGYQVGKGIGTKAGSTVGANNPFPLKGDKKQETPVVTLDQSNAKVAEARQRYIDSR